MSSKSAVPVPMAGAQLHAGSKGDYGDDLDIDEMIEKMGCAKEYYQLEECLGEYDRDWTKCQGIVKELKQCNDRLRELKDAQAAAAARREQQ